MALIVEYHVVADVYPISGNITAGMLVSLNAAGQAIATVAGATDAVGLAGDSALATEGQTTAYSAQVVIGADGAGTRYTENRVSDFYDETVASQKVTVYNGGGKFWISSDLLESGVALVPGEHMRVSTADAGEWADAGTNTIGDTVAICVNTVAAYDSGVPGTDVAAGSMTLGDYFAVVLRI